MVSSNGRWQVPGNSDKGNDPDSDFPIRQVFTDYSGRARHFVITFFRAKFGFGVQAEEEGKDGQGYCFREFDPTSPYLALGRIRGRIKQALSVRLLNRVSQEISKQLTKPCEVEFHTLPEKSHSS